MTKYEAADRAVKAHDDFLFASCGRPFNPGHADVLALYAGDACADAARDRSVNQVTRDYCASLREQFRAICA